MDILVCLVQIYRILIFKFTKFIILYFIFIAYLFAALLPKYYIFSFIVLV